MPFNSKTKARMFIKSARLCCLCYKQCGTNIEAAHIVAEAEGGSNDEENGIPLCFDCHQEIGGYDIKHPKGNKFTNVELKNRRDKVYELVESGFLQAQIILDGFHKDRRLNKEKNISKEAIPKEYKPTKEVSAVLSLAQNELKPSETIPFKLKLLNKTERAYIIDKLVEEFDKTNYIEPIFSIVANDEFNDISLIILEQVIRKVTIFDNLDLKNKFMCGVPINVFKLCDIGLRIIFFTEIINMLERVQFVEVNKITRCLIKVQEAIPDAQLGRYFSALIGMIGSNAYKAEPIAHETLLSLPDKFGSIAVDQIDQKYLIWNHDKKFNKKFLAKYSHIWPKNKINLFKDYIDLKSMEFSKKYWRE